MRWRRKDPCPCREWNRFYSARSIVTWLLECIERHGKDFSLQHFALKEIFSVLLADFPNLRLPEIKTRITIVWGKRFMLTALCTAVTAFKNSVSRTKL
jgi:hypothetical protein